MTVEALGVGALGTEPLAGLLSQPTVAITSLGTVSTGGPNLTVAWTFTPAAAGGAQASYRVRLLNDALSTVYYDSGILSGADLSHVVDVDANGIPHDTSDITAEVTVIDVNSKGALDTDAFVLDWGKPHCTITFPVEGGVHDDPSEITPTWTFTDDKVGATQGAYRVRLIHVGTGVAVHDSGWVSSAATSHVIEALLGNFESYRVEVQLKNNHGIRSD